MKHQSREHLIQQLLDGNLTAEEERKLREQIEESADLREALEQRLQLRKLLQDNPGQFSPYFSTRVMAHLHGTSQEEEWMGGLLRVFRRVAYAAVVLALFFTAHNVISQWDQRSTKNAIELTLGIPSETVASSLDYLDYWL